MLFFVLAAFAESVVQPTVPATVINLPVNPTRGAVYSSTLSLQAARARAATAVLQAPVRIGEIEVPIRVERGDRKLPSGRSISNGMVRAPTR